MKLSEMSFFQIASQRMQWLGRRQAVVSENIANADTPNFKAKDVSPFAEMIDGARGSGLQVTNSKHLGGLNTAQGVRVQTDPTVRDSSLTGNTVMLEEQTIKSADISENYRMAAELYRKGHDLLTLAVTGTR